MTFVNNDLDRKYSKTDKITTYRAILMEMRKKLRVLVHKKDLN